MAENSTVMVVMEGGGNGFCPSANLQKVLIMKIYRSAVGVRVTSMENRIREWSSNLG